MNLWDYIDPNAVERVPESGIVTAILPKAGREAKVFVNASRIPHATAYRREDIPDEFHYNNNPRIMPVIIQSEEGWMLSAVCYFFCASVNDDVKGRK
jgi:ectonucleotide pyrophosphatase/phosphodiesterase family protein 5